ncbi:MAG: ABC transporter permease [Flavobacterium sp.]|nr:ABC transporter permease [Candidatus Neoflavobacterium equi]
MIGLFYENTKIALGSIKTQILRTILTVLIIAIGILALVAILTVVNAVKSSMTSNFAAMGANTFSITQYDFTKQMEEKVKVNPIINYPEALAFKEKYNYPFTTTSIAFTATSVAEVKYENKKTDPEVTVVGADEMYTNNKGMAVVEGRNFNSFDIENNSNVCIIGSDLYKKLFKDINALNKTISVRGAKFKVVGVLKERGSTFGQKQDMKLLIPLHVARSLFSAPNINYDIDIMIPNQNLMDQAIDQAKVQMRMIRKLAPSQETNFGLERSDSTLNTLLSNLNTLEVGAWVISFITILGSSIALMNIMLVSVTERTREIGVRKSLGAKKNTIATQFFTETLVISFIGGFLGIVFGILIGYSVGKAMEFEFATPWMAIIAAVITTFLVAIVSGLYPAVKASKLDPVEALRYE